MLGGGRGVCIDVKVGAVQGPTGRTSATRPFETEVTQLPGSPAPKTFPVFMGHSLTHRATPGKAGLLRAGKQGRGAPPGVSAPWRR